MTVAHINRIGTATPALDIHQTFVTFIRSTLQQGKFDRVFERMVERSGISRRYSVLQPEEIAVEPTSQDVFYGPDIFPGTARRMRAYERYAPELAMQAIAALDLADEAPGITHLVVASCTGFCAPGLDQILQKRLGLRDDLQRSLVGFMGCSAAIPALRIAQNAILADPQARVLVVNLELCSLHFQKTEDLEQALLFLLFGDGCSATLVTAEPNGIALHDFRAALIPDSEAMITWHIGNDGFDMTLSGQVPWRITQTLRAERAREDAGGLLRGEGTQSIDLWAVHGGGRSILDAVEAGFALDRKALEASRDVLNECGNMSSATVMFVLKRMLDKAVRGKRGLAMAFGPGVTAETFRFSMA